jgi:hypothetical protein
MTGTVVEAYGDFADLAGRPVEMSGTFYAEDDGTTKAPGELTIS